MKNITRHSIVILCFVAVAGCAKPYSFLAPLITLPMQGGAPMGMMAPLQAGRAPLPGDRVYKKSRFMFNPQRNTVGWTIAGSDENRVSMFSGRSFTWFTGGYLPFRYGESFSTVEELLEKFKEAETAFLKGEKKTSLTKPAVNQGFENLYGEINFKPRVIDKITFYTTEYSADLHTETMQMRQRIILYLLPEENGLYVIAMVVAEDRARERKLPMRSFMDIVRNFITKKPAGS